RGAVPGQERAFVSERKSRIRVAPDLLEPPLTPRAKGQPPPQQTSLARRRLVAPGRARSSRAGVRAPLGMRFSPALAHHRILLPLRHAHGDRMFRRCRLRHWTHHGVGSMTAPDYACVSEAAGFDADPAL